MEVAIEEGVQDLLLDMLVLLSGLCNSSVSSTNLNFQSVASENTPPSIETSLKI